MMILVDLQPIGKCVTTTTPLIGTHHWSPNMFIKLIQHFGLEKDVAKHLSESYGDKAWTVASLASETGTRFPLFGKKLSPGYPYIEAEVKYACRREYACTAVDFLARRSRLSYLNARAALESLPRVIEIMASELGWDGKRCQVESEEARVFLLSMGLSIKEQNSYPKSTLIGDDSAHFVAGDIDKFHQAFDKVSLEQGRGRGIPQATLGSVLKQLDFQVKPLELEAILSQQVKTGDVLDFEEFLQLLALVKDAKTNKKFEDVVSKFHESRKVEIERSGGGI